MNCSFDFNYIYELVFIYSSGDNLYLNVDPQAVCRFNPCKYTTCLQGAAAKCVVNTRCHPVFLDAFGKTIKCKGNKPCNEILRAKTNWDLIAEGTGKMFGFSKII